MIFLDVLFFAKYSEKLILFVNRYCQIFGIYVLTSTALSSLIMFLAVALPSYADQGSNVDNLKVSSVIDGNFLSAGMKIESQNSFPLGKDSVAIINSEVEISPVDNFSAGSLLSTQNLDLTNEESGQGIDVKRLSAKWNSNAGVLTVGSDWANFQDFLGDSRNDNLNTSLREKFVSSQIKWHSPNGFSVSLEEVKDNDLFNTLSEINGQNSDDTSSSVVLSWQGATRDGLPGEYRISTMGTRLDSSSSGQSFTAGDSDLGWGINLEGGWQIRDLFAVLSITYGKGIDSYILRKFGNDLMVTPNNFNQDQDILGIKPSLYYQLNSGANIHVLLGRYAKEEGDITNGIDTLDTIHLGYSWSPWPSAKVGVELVGQSVEGLNGTTKEHQINVEAQANF